MKAKRSCTYVSEDWCHGPYPKMELCHWRMIIIDVDEVID